ncbi:MAG: hypothetical protein ACKODB_05075, partial [Betaproteobacteria bacterium]
PADRVAGCETDAAVGTAAAGGGAAGAVECAVAGPIAVAVAGIAGAAAIAAGVTPGDTPAASPAASSDSSTVAVPFADAAKPQAPMSLAATALGSPTLGTSSPASGGSSVDGSSAVPPSGDGQGATSPELCRVGGADLARLAVLDSTVRPLDGARGHAVLLEVER